MGWPNQLAFLEAKYKKVFFEFRSPHLMWRGSASHGNDTDHDLRQASAWGLVRGCL